MIIFYIVYQIRTPKSKFSKSDILNKVIGEEILTKVITIELGVPPFYLAHNPKNWVYRKNIFTP